MRARKRDEHRDDRTWLPRVPERLGSCCWASAALPAGTWQRSRSLRCCYRAVTPYSAARFPIRTFSSGVKLSYVPRLDVRVSFPSGLSNTCFTSLLAATILEEGITVERGPSGFGSDDFTRRRNNCRKGTIVLW